MRVQLNHHAKNSNLNPVERAAAWRKYLANNGVATGSPTGTALAEQKNKSAAGQVRSRREQRRMETRIDQVAEQIETIHQTLLAAGWMLVNESESGSRYYERDGQHVRVSDHAANEATDRWMQSVGCVEVTTVEQAKEII
jgi:hypothetical protein